MHAGRWILAFAALVAVALAIGLGLTALRPADLAVGPGPQIGVAECAAAYSSPAYFGIELRNQGGTPITIRGLDDGDLQQVSVLGAWTLHHWTEGSTFMSFGVLDDPASMGTPWGDRRDVAGTIVPAHDGLSLVVELGLDPGQRDGAARAFRVLATNSAGVTTAIPSGTVIGFGTSDGVCSL